MSTSKAIMKKENIFVSEFHETSSMKQLTPFLIKFSDENIGKFLSGSYEGYTLQKSTFNPEIEYCNHKLKLFNGFVVCFNGSKSLDECLETVLPGTIVHIRYDGLQTLASGHNFKKFTIFCEEPQVEESIEVEDD